MQTEKQCCGQSKGNSLNHIGEIVLTPEEEVYLNRKLQEQFEKHKIFEGVEVNNLSLNEIPKDIQNKIRGIGGTLTAFVAIKAEKEIPIHQHTADCEVYFGGSNGIVILLDTSKKEIGKFDLSKNSFTNTEIGEWHGVNSNGEQKVFFFGVKYVTEK